MNTAGGTSGTSGVPILGYRPLPAIACRMFMSPISSQTALWTIRSIIASVCTPPPSPLVLCFVKRI